MTPTAKTTPAPVGAPVPMGKSTESPIMDLFHRHWPALTVLVVGIVGISIFQQVLPRMRADSQEASWELHRELTTSPGAFDAESVDDTLRQAREDDRIYKWVVLSGVQFSLRQGDKEALVKLRPAFQELADKGAFAGFGSFGEGGGDLANLINERIASELSGSTELPVFANPEPTGARIKISLTIGEGEVYAFVVGLYDDVAPEACGNFLAAVQALRLAEIAATPQGFHAAKFAGLAAIPAEGEDPVEPTGLPLERSWGHFNYMGALTTAPKPLTGAGAQDENSFLLTFADNLALDGTVTVFGKVVEGAEILADLAALGRDPNLPAQFASSVQIVGAEILN
ncbi:MAG TPA: peptidylprolyl isomerase [Planctomycetota bacterium]